MASGGGSERVEAVVEEQAEGGSAMQDEDGDVVVDGLEERVRAVEIGYVSDEEMQKDYCPKDILSRDSVLHKLKLLEASIYCSLHLLGCICRPVHRKPSPLHTP